MGLQLMIGNFNIVASVARLVWRFASDKGLPFHQHFVYVSLIERAVSVSLCKRAGHGIVKPANEPRRFIQHYKYRSPLSSSWASSVASYR